MSETQNLEEIKNQLQQSGNVQVELLEIFNEEAEEHLRIMYDGLNQAKVNSDNQAIEEVRRSAHTLKGAAGAVGLTCVTRLAHRMEDLLDSLVEIGEPASAQQVKLLLTTTDMVQELTTQEIHNVDEMAELVAAIYAGYDDQLGSETVLLQDDSENAMAQDKATAKESEDADKEESEAEEERRLAKRRLGERRENPKAKQRFLRVSMRKLDDLVGLVGEMIVNRSTMDRRLQELETRIEEVMGTVERVRTSSTDLEASHRIHNARRKSSNFTGQLSGVDIAEIDRYSEFHLLAHLLAEGNSDVDIIASELGKLKQEMDSLTRKQDRLNRSAQINLMQIRMVPLKTIVSRLDRTIRSVSNKLGKNVELSVTGDETQLDKTVLDQIVDPLQHLIRNSIDHGIESAEQRSKSGKPALANVRLEAVHMGNQVTLRLSDDGQGLDQDRIREKAIQNELIQSTDELSREELFALIFLPGFSTADSLTEVSGRGVGMDVVREAIIRMNGSIRVTSEPGQGTCFTIQLPTSVGVTSALMVKSGRQMFAIPMQAIAKIRRLILEDIKQVNEKLFVVIDEKELALRELASHLQLEANPNLMSPDSPPPVLILQIGDEEIAMIVDSVVGGEEIVIKNLGEHLRNVPGLLGATVMGDGTIVPILDPVDLVSSMAMVQPANSDIDRRREIQVSMAMVIDDSISVRRATSGLLQNAGWDVVTANDGLDALEKLEDMECLPDIFLCDMEMPRMDGIELIKRLRRQDEFQGIPMVMITSRASEKHRHMAFEAGVTEYVVKPYDRDFLLHLVDELVQAQRETVNI